LGSIREVRWAHLKGEGLDQVGGSTSAFLFCHCVCVLTTEP
jgi:hypothetical protein